jgi:hypothetical protein
MSRKFLLALTVAVIACVAGCNQPEQERVAAESPLRAGTPAAPGDAPAPGPRAEMTERHPTEHTDAAPTVAASVPVNALSQKEIVIDSISSVNPLVVKGRARTFENAVSVRVRDSKGTLLAEEHVTSIGEMGRHNPFEAQVWLVREPGAHLTVEAFEYSAKDGSVRSLAAKTADYNVVPISLALTFPRGDCTKFASVTRKAPKSIAMARLMVEALLAGPTAAEKKSGVSSAFPSGSDVRSVILRNGVVTVDFNERLRNVGGACAATAIRESVTRTLKQLPSVKRVVITAGGSESLALQP